MSTLAAYLPRRNVTGSSLGLFTLFIGILTGVALTELFSYLRKRHRQTTKTRSLYNIQPEIARGVVELIGNTPLVRINSLSDATGCEILAKAEYLNPGGSSKDRVALYIIRQAERDGLLQPPIYDPITQETIRSTVFEGTVGSTGISLAMISRALGYACHIVVPDDQAEEKYALLERHGATIEKVRPASIVDPKQFVNLARERARAFDQKQYERALKLGQHTQSYPRGFFADQFENLANFRAHYETTGPEIWRQTSGRIDAFVAGAGTGGTIAGVARYLKARQPHIHITLADPIGSGLYNKIKHGVFFAPQEAEGKRRRHQVDTVVEGVGINRLTRNFAMALPYAERAAFHEILMNSMEDVLLADAPWQRTAQDRGWIDDAICVTDEEAVAMSRYLVYHEGLFVGSSSAVNCVAAVRLARQLGPGHTIVTLLCDSGQRHLTKFWSDDYLRRANIPIHTPHDLTFIV